MRGKLVCTFSMCGLSAAVVMSAASPAAARAYCHAEVCVNSECHPNYCDRLDVKANVLGKCQALVDTWLPEFTGHAKATRSAWLFGHKTATEAWITLGAGCNPKSGYAKAWFTTGAYRVTGPEGSTAELRVVVRESGLAEPPEGHGEPPMSYMPEQGAFTERDLMIRWTTDIAVTQGSVTTPLFTGSGAVGGPEHSTPGLILTGDYIGPWYEWCTMAECGANMYESLYGSATVTVNANEVFYLAHDESLTIDSEEPFDQEDIMVEGAASFIVDLELVDQSGTYQFEYVDEGEELVPAASMWGLGSMALLLLIVAKIYVGGGQKTRVSACG